VGDADADVRFAALQTWDRLHRGNQEGNKALVRLLKDADPGIRRLAVEALLAAASGHSDSVVTDALSALLSDPDGVLRCRAVLGLSYRDSPDTMHADHLAILIAAAGDSAPEVRREAAAVMGRFLPQESKTLVPILSQGKWGWAEFGLLLDKIPAVQREAAFRLLAAKEQTEKAASALLAQLPSSDPNVRGEAARLLGFVGGNIAGVRQKLVTALDDPSVYVRQSAAGALAKIGGEDKAVVQALEQRLEDKDAIVRVSAATALLANGAKRKGTIEIIQNALLSGEIGVQETALAGLAGLLAVPAELEPVLGEVVYDPSPTIRQRAVLLVSSGRLTK
jgi:HEAT repeat protein